jgi:hypothetical protein
MNKIIVFLISAFALLSTTLSAQTVTFSAVTGCTLPGFAYVPADAKCEAISTGSGNTTSTSLTVNTLPKSSGVNSVVNSLFSDDGTNGGYSGAGGFTVSNPTGGVGSQWVFNQEGTLPPGLSASGKDAFYSDSAQHRILSTFNGGPVLPLAQIIASGSSSLGTSSIASGLSSCPVVTVAAPNVVTTDVIGWGFNGNPTTVVGYKPGPTGMLTIIAYPTAGAVNFAVCNNTSASITPGAITLNWRIER